MKRWILCLCLPCLLWLGGCAGVPPQVPPAATVLADELFAAPSEPVQVNDLFDLTQEMRRYLEARLAPGTARTRPQQALLDALYTRGELRLEYDSARTRTAREAFEARAGNCLSLVIMTAAFAKALDVPVRFQSVDEATLLERNGDVVFMVGHVNLALGPSLSATGAGPESRNWLLVDFLPGQDLRRLRTQEIDERRVRAMFMNNRAAEALSQARLADAYWWARGAVLADGHFTNSYNTLGVIYRRQGALVQAERALRVALTMETDSVPVMSNLVATLQAQGRAAEAQALQDRLQRLEPVAPYAWFDQGMQALRDGEFRQARSLFARELERAPYNHEFHHWMAVSYERLGDRERARRHLELAAENSSTREQNGRYAAKLAWLKDQALH